eukprot:CAMPEP_0196791762 /NCGR_PEP_ID=MMETSP1104-20130614/30337_1 /TAXON_ID=33652 /ORGANISM="Cafeteria sp., Strain Caron Lab Isolate" /LENGTH=50 /DNA_ID=CAMNT_0042162125 /DNA_START=60 /DNA_END=208 /DNA_ORIENTATION=+
MSTTRQCALSESRKGRKYPRLRPPWYSSSGGRFDVATTTLPAPHSSANSA